MESGAHMLKKFEFFNSTPGCRQVRAIQKYLSFFPKTIHFSTIQNFCDSFCIYIVYTK